MSATKGKHRLHINLRNRIREVLWGTQGSCGPTILVCPGLGRPVIGDFNCQNWDSLRQIRMVGPPSRMWLLGAIWGSEFVRTLVGWRRVFWSHFTSWAWPSLSGMKGVVTLLPPHGLLGIAVEWLWWKAFARHLGFLSARDDPSFRGKYNSSLPGGKCPFLWEEFFREVTTGTPRFLNLTARGISHRCENKSTCASFPWEVWITNHRVQDHQDATG